MGVPHLLPEGVHDVDGIVHVACNALTQCRQSAVHRIGCGGHHTRIPEVAVDQRLGIVHLRGHSRRGKQFGVAAAVVAQRVVARNRDIRRAQLRQVLGARRCQRRGHIREVQIAHIPTGKPLDRRAAEQWRVGILVNDGSDVSHVVAGYHNSWNRIGGPPASRASCATTAVRLPPAESPAMASRSGSAPSSPACAATHCVAAQASSTAAG